MSATCSQNIALTFAAIGDPRFSDPKTGAYTFDLAAVPADQGFATACLVKQQGYKSVALFTHGRHECPMSLSFSPFA